MFHIPFYCRTLEIASMSIGRIRYCVWNIPVLLELLHLSMRSLISLFSNIPTALHVEISPITMTILLEQAEKVSPYFKGFSCYD